MSLSSSERELLQIVARLIDPVRAPEERYCSAGLAELLRRHHLRPLAHADGVQNLGDANQQCAVLAALHRRTLEDVGRAFEKHGIPWTVIKGAAYAWTLYAVPEHRPMSDLDILVRDADFEHAGKILLDCGFSQRPVSVRTRHAQTYYRASHEIVDLHRSILQPMRSNAGMTRAWQRAQPKSSSFPGFWQLDLVDHCWIHVAHMARHEFVVPLIAYVDLQRLLRALSARGPILAEELESTRLRYALAVGLQVVNALRSGQIDTRDLRMRFVMPTIEELLAGHHRSRPEQIAKKLALFPRDTLKLGAAWALRTGEDRFIRARWK